MQTVNSVFMLAYMIVSVISAIRGRWDIATFFLLIEALEYNQE